MIHDLQLWHYRVQRWQVEDLLCVWQQPLLESWGDGLMEGALTISIRIRRSTSVLLGSESHGQGRAHVELPSPVFHPMGAFNQKCRLRESSKCLKEPQMELLKHLISPIFPKESTARLKEWRASADHLLTLFILYIPDTKKPNPRELSEVWSGNYSGQERVGLMIFLNMDAQS